MNFQMDTESVVVQKVCTNMLQNIAKNRRHKLKREYFDPLPANQVSIKSPVPYVNDAEWDALVTMWSSPEHKVCMHMCLWSYFHVMAYFDVSAAV